MLPRAPWVCRRCVGTLLALNKRSSTRYSSTLAGGSSSSFSPALLLRARSLSAEHDRLSLEISEHFDTKISKRIGELKSVAAALRAWEEAQDSLSELDALLKDPAADAELRELATDDIATTTIQVDELGKRLATSLTPRHPFADLGCLLEIRPGAGGGEAALFASDLLRMYKAYCARKGFRTSLLKYDVGEGEAGTSGDPPLTEAVLEIETAGAYDELRCEAGVHRVQRVPATESKGRTHTSAAGVMVLPSFPKTGADGQEAWEADMNDPTSDYYVNPADVRTDIMRARGAGGQHVNTTDSAVRLTHMPTNTVVSMQDTRSQHKNREKAWQLLRARLAQARREAREEEMVRMRRNVIGVARMGRGDKVRTYNWGQQRVTDHRSGISVHNLDDVMEGGLELDRVMESVKGWLGDREIEALIAEDMAESNG